MERRNYVRALALVLAMLMLCSCGQRPPEAAAEEPLKVQLGETLEVQMEEPLYTDAVPLEEVNLEDEIVALTEAPAAVPVLAPAVPGTPAEVPAAVPLLVPAAAGTLVEKNGKAMVDYSNTQDGYVMVKYIAATDKRLKVQVTGSTTTYTYNLAADAAWDTYPLSDGNGSYKVTVYENIVDTKYTPVLSKTFSVTLKDEFAPFLRPNQYVDYEVAPKTLAKAEELTRGLTDPLEKVKAVYEYVVSNLTYDRQKAATVKSGYLPVLDTVLEKKSGICFDYAALMTAMLRSQGVPCKLVIGYAGTAYHAWISVYSEKSGWIDAAIYFDGVNWLRMDPTFASSGKQSASIMEYIGNGSNYAQKYLY